MPPPIIARRRFGADASSSEEGSDRLLNVRLICRQKQRRVEGIGVSIGITATYEGAASYRKTVLLYRPEDTIPGIGIISKKQNNFDGFIVVCGVIQTQKAFDRRIRNSRQEGIVLMFPLKFAIFVCALVQPILM